MKKLVAEGFVLEEKFTIQEEHFIAYSISFDGILFYESASVKERPFHSQLLKHKKEELYNTIKTIVVVLNALALILLSILTLKLQDKSNQVEQKQLFIDSLSRRVEVQKFTIDSLHKTISDTLKRP